MAEAFLNHLAKDRFLAESAGLEPGKLNQAVVKVMAEIGIDISGNQTKSVAAMLRQNKSYDYVLTVCDETSAGRCPVFPGPGKCLHWYFPDPARMNDISEIRKIRDAIKIKIEDWVKTINVDNDSQGNPHHSRCS